MIPLAIGILIGACGWICAACWWGVARTWRRVADDVLALAVREHENFLRARSDANALQRLLSESER